MRNAYIFILSLFFLFSCNIMHCPNQKTFIESFSEFVDEVETKRSQEKAPEWDTEDAAFKDYVDRCYPEFKDELTADQSKQFWNNTIKYYYNRYDGNLAKAHEAAKANHSKAFYDDFVNTISSGDADLMGLAKELFGNDLKKGIDSVLEMLNNLGDQLKENIDETNKE